MAEVDSLTIRINAETGSAVAQLKQITSLVEKLNAAASDSKWKSFANSLSRVGDASKNLGKLTGALKSIQNTQVSPKLKENLDKIADASARLSGVGKGVSQFGSGLTRIAKLSENADKLGENLRRVSSHVIDFSRSISKLIPDDFGNKAITLSKLASALKSFSKIGEDTDLKTKFAGVADAVGLFAKRLNEAVSDDMLTRLERIAGSLSQIAAFANKAGKSLKALQKASQSQNDNQAQSLAKKWQMVVKAVEAVNKAISEMGRDLYSALDSTGIIGDLDGMTGAIAKNIPVLGELTAAWRSAASQIKSIVLSNASVVDKAANLMLVRVSLIVRTLYSLVKMPFGSTSTGITKGIVKGLISPFRNLASAITDLSKRWNKFTSSLGRIAIYRLIRSALKEISKAIKEGVQNLYQWGQAWQNTYSSAAKFVDSMDKLSTAFLYLKNSIGAAVSPLIDMVAPIIDALVDRFVALTNAINQALAALSGAGVWRRALKYQYTYAEAAGMTTKALKRTVLAFDELNKLDDKNKGGSGDNLDYSKMFEEAPVDDWLAKILESSSWRLLGTGIAGKINEALANINWDSIQSTARIWARRFGSLLDGVLMGISMPLLGKSIAEGINTIALSINTFFKEFHFVQLGQHLADGFESMVNNMDWGSIGRAMTQKWRALFELVIGFQDVDLTGLGAGIAELYAEAIENLPVKDLVDAFKKLIPKIGKELGIAIGGMIEEANSIVSGIDASGLGVAFSKAIDNMLEGIDPKEAGIFLSNGLKKIIEFSAGALKTLNWSKVTSWVSDAIISIFDNIDLKQGVQNAVDIATKIVDLLTTVVKAIPWKEVGDAIAEADTTELKNGIKGLFKAATDGLEKSGFMDEIAVGIASYFALKIGGAIAKAVPSMLTAKAIFGGSAGASASTGAASAGTAIGTSIGTSIIAGIAAALDGGIVGKLIDNYIIGPILEKLGSDSADWYKNFHWFGEGGFFRELFDFNSLNEAIEVYKGAFGLMYEDAKTNFENMKLAISSIWTSIKDEVIGGALGGIITKIRSIDIAGAWNTVLNKLKSSTNTILDSIQDKFKVTFSALLGGIAQLGDEAGKLGKAAATGPRRAEPRINMRASGGTVDKGDLFIAGEAGPEIVTSFGGESTVMNMDQIISTIAQSVALANGGDITIPVILDGGMLDKVIVTAQQRQNLRSGR
ncbi:MAG: hypothetical protein IJ819_00075 [Clostridiales bacterium]|nr:hypothetical protein [Clostridiales bacterium]